MLRRPTKLLDCPDVFACDDDHRLFLKKLYEMRKARFTRYSYARLGAELNVTTTPYLFSVVKGKRNLSMKMVEKIESAFNWGTLEKSFFRHMVQYNQAKKPEDRAFHKREMDKIRGRYRKRLHPDEYEFFSHWYIPVIRELIAFSNFVANYNWVSRALLLPVKEVLIKKAFDVLERLQLIQKKGGRWIQSEAHLTTDTETQSELIPKYHKEMIRLSLQATELPAKERDVSAITMSISKGLFEKLKKRLVDFRYEIQNDIQDDEGVPEVVAQLNMQLFPIAKKPLDKKPINSNS